MAETLLTLEAVTDRIGFKRSKIYAMIAAGEFPAPIKFGSASRWPESKVTDWIDQRIAAADTHTDA